MKSCIMLLTLELLSVQTPRGHRVSFLCGQQVQPEAPESWPPAGGPRLLSTLLKAFPQPDIKPSARRQTSRGHRLQARFKQDGWEGKRREKKVKGGGKGA